ncbi:MAG: hypothetical protein JSW06_02140 [Thermoplasmatales archaeon]|nr:MAG: hypothetical protein JSW06_02140 [Thermoplasmatales archaeon]
MKKITILLIALMVLSLGFLSGCNEQDEKNSFIGAWLMKIPENPDLEIILTFFTNGSVKREITLVVTRLIKTEWSNYEIKNDEICGLPQFDYNQTCLYYEFSNSNNILNLTAVETNYLYVYEKI